MSTTTRTMRSPRRAALEVGHAPARAAGTPCPDGVPRGIDEVLGAVERVELEVGAEGGLGERRSAARSARSTPSRVNRSWGCDPHVDVEVAVGAAPWARPRRGR